MHATKVAVKWRTVTAQIVVGSCGSPSHLLQVYALLNLVNIKSGMGALPVGTALTSVLGGLPPGWGGLELLSVGRGQSF